LKGGVKHLNPRQGITTDETVIIDFRPGVPRVCETPKSPPGDYNLICQKTPRCWRCSDRVKHLNPRQGITTERPNFDE